MDNIIILGNLSYNINLFFNSYPNENTTCYIDKKYKSIGNNLNVPIVLSKYNLNVYYFSSIGNDYEGNEILKFLKQNNINIDYINVINNIKTNQKYIIRNIKNDSKTFLNSRFYIKYKLNNNINFKPNVIYNDSYDLEIIKYLKNKYKDSKIITNLSELSTNSLNICTLSDYIILPLKYAQMLSNVKLDITNKKSIISLYIKTKRLFSGKIIIYVENLGCIYENNNVISIITKLGDMSKVNKSSYDIFTSSFVYGINKCFSLEKTLKISMLSKFLSDNDKQNLNIKEVIDIYEKNN